MVTTAEFSPTSISDLHGWYDCSDLTTITKDGSDRVSQIDDKSGNNFDLVQATASKQPLWVDDGQNGIDTVDFAGDRTIQVDWTDISQPVTIAIACRSPASTSSEGRIWDGYTDSMGFYNEAPIIGGNMNIFAPSGVGYSKVGFVSVWEYFTNIYDTTSSIARAGGVQQATGNVGTNQSKGITLSSSRNESAGMGQIICGEVTIYDKAVSGTELTDLETYLKDKWGL
jgi:hypothetical protein